MQITGWHIEGFGHFQALTVADLPPGLTVLHGPNEAGKSTLLEFIRFVLFGSERGRKPARLTSGRVGGRLALRDGETPLVIERLEGTPAVLHERGLAREGDDGIRQRLGGLDRELFRAICGFSLADLEGLHGLGDATLRDRLFSGALLGAGRSVAAARKSLADRRSRLWRPRTASEIRDLQTSRDAALAALSAARGQARGLGQLRIRLALADDEVGASREVAERARREVARYVALRRAWPHQAELAEIGACLSALPTQRVDPALREPMNRLRLAEAQARASRDGEAERVAEARAALGAIRPDPAVLAAGSAIDTLVSRREGASDADLAPLRIELQAARVRLADGLEGAGLADGRALAALRIGQAVREELRDISGQVRQAERVDAGRKAAEEALSAAVADVNRALAVREGLARDPVAEAVADEVADLDRDARRIRATQQRVASLDARIRDWSARAAGFPAVPADFEANPAATGALRAAVVAWQQRAAEARAAREHAVHRQESALAVVSAVVPPSIPVATMDALERRLDGAIEAQVRSESGAEAARVERDRAGEVRQELGDTWSEARVDALVLDSGVRGGLEVRARAAREAGFPGGSGERDSVLGRRGWVRPALGVLSLGFLGGGLIAVATGFATFWTGGGGASLGGILAGALLAASAALLATICLFLPAGASAGRRAAAGAAWRQALVEAGLDADLRPEGLEQFLTQLRLARDRLRTAREVGREAHALAHRWEEWCREAGQLAAGLGLGAPVSPGQARALVQAWQRVAATAANDVEARARVAAAAADVAAADRVGGAASALEPPLRARAHALGVPEAVALADAPEWLWRVEQAAILATQRADAVADREAAQGEVDAWTARYRAAAVALGAAEQPLAVLATRCRSAERSRAVWAQADEALGSAARRRDALEGAHATFGGGSEGEPAATRAWLELLSTAGLPATLTPSGLEAFLDAVRRARAAADDEARLAALVAAIEERVRALEAAAGQAADEVGVPRPVTGVEARELGDRLGRALVAARAEERRRAEAEREVELAEARFRASEVALGQASEDLAALLGTQGASSVSELEAAFEVAARQLALLSRFDAASVGRREALGAAADDPAVLALLANGDLHAWSAAEGEAEGVFQAALAGGDEAVRSRTRLADELDAVERSADVGQGMARLSVVEARLDAARRAYLEVVVADALLDRTLTRFREAHQPAVLKAAGAYLSRATGGRYVAIEATDDGRDVVVLDEVGGRRCAAELSRGTLELLYVVLRLGLAADRASHSVSLPLVLDDVLVNLDPERALGLTRLLAHAAGHQQVLLLTCRPETRDLLLAQVPDAHVLELPRYAGRANPVPSRVAPAAAPPPPAIPVPVRPPRALEGRAAPPKQEALFQVEVPES